MHGNFKQLQQQLQAINFDYNSDILILTGDIIDRGSENADMINFATCTPGIYSVLGNHESMFLEAVRAVYTSAKMGGDWIEAYTNSELEEMATLIESCHPIAITVDFGDAKIGVIHAASPPNWQDVFLKTLNSISGVESSLFMLKIECLRITSAISTLWCTVMFAAN